MLGYYIKRNQFPFLVLIKGAVLMEGCAAVTGVFVAAGALGVILTGQDG